MTRVAGLLAHVTILSRSLATKSQAAFALLVTAHLKDLSSKGQLVLWLSAECSHRDPSNDPDEGESKCWHAH